MTTKDQSRQWYVECANHDCRKAIFLGDVSPHKDSIPKTNKYELECPHCGH